MSRKSRLRRYVDILIRQNRIDRAEGEAILQGAGVGTRFADRRAERAAAIASNVIKRQRELAAEDIEPSVGEEVTLKENGQEFEGRVVKGGGFQKKTVLGVREISKQEQLQRQIRSPNRESTPLAYRTALPENRPSVTKDILEKTPEQRVLSNIGVKVEYRLPTVTELKEKYPSTYTSQQYTGLEKVRSEIDKGEFQITQKRNLKAIPKTVAATSVNFLATPIIRPKETITGIVQTVKNPVGAYVGIFKSLYERPTSTVTKIGLSYGSSYLISRGITSAYRKLNTPQVKVTNTVTERRITKDTIVDNSWFDATVKKPFGKEAKFAGRSVELLDKVDDQTYLGTGKLQFTNLKTKKVYDFSIRSVGTNKKLGFDKVSYISGKNVNVVGTSKTASVLKQPYQKFVTYDVTSQVRGNVYNLKPISEGIGVTKELYLQDLFKNSNFFSKDIVLESGKTIGSQKLLETSSLSTSQPQNRYFFDYSRTLAERQAFDIVKPSGGAVKLVSQATKQVPTLSQQTITGTLTQLTQPTSISRQGIAIPLTIGLSSKIKNSEVQKQSNVVSTKPVQDNSFVQKQKSAQGQRNRLTLEIKPKTISDSLSDEARIPKLSQGFSSILSNILSQGQMTTQTQVQSTTPVPIYKQIVTPKSKDPTSFFIPMTPPPVPPDTPSPTSRKQKKKSNTKKIRRLRRDLFYTPDLLAQLTGEKVSLLRKSRIGATLTGFERRPFI